MSTTVEVVRYDGYVVRYDGYSTEVYWPCCDRTWISDSSYRTRREVLAWAERAHEKFHLASPSPDTAQERSDGE